VNGDLLSIGAFARMTRLTVKALRHYDAEDLLVPAHVDPATGYRSYALSQVPDAATIALLRRLGVPVPTVRELLSGDHDTRASVLAAERERLALEVEERRRALATIERLVSSPEAARYDVRLEERPARTLGAISGDVDADALDEGTGALCARLGGVLAAAGSDATRAPFVAAFPLDLDERFEVFVGVAPPPDVVGLEPVELPGGTWATTLHVGSYATLALAYRALLDRSAELGVEPVAPFTETYLNDPTAAPESELVTALAVRVL
jgi:DNA-binding transcriptional MerR regulator